MYKPGVPLGRVPTEAKKASRDASVNRIAVFVDVQNIYYTTRQAYGRQFDYRKLWQRISAEGEIVSANAYAIDRGDARQQKFQKALKDSG